jgi:hypothetical protein
MNSIATQNIKTLDIINELESHMDALPETMHGDCFPLEHSFAKGLYVRQISVPKGYLIISKIHKYSHAAFLLKGEISIIGTDGIRRIKAPMPIITPAGTKRAIYHHEDTVFSTVHATNETDLLKIEDEIIVKDFKEIGDCIDVEFTSCVRHFLEKGGK